MVGRRNRGIFLSRHECTGLLKKGESSIQQWSGFGHKFIPPDPGKEAIFQKQLRRYSTTTRANHLRLDIGDINEEVCFNFVIQIFVGLIVFIWYIQLFSTSLKVSKRVCEKRRKKSGRQAYFLLCSTGLIIPWAYQQVPYQMAGEGVDDLVVHLEKSLDISNMEQGIKLVGMALVSKTLNKWGIRNILRSSWQRWGEIEIKWVKENTFVIKVKDESTAAKIIDQVPWAVMKQNFVVKRWPSEIALEEIDMQRISFWIQIRGVPPFLSSEANIKRLASKIGKVQIVEDPAKSRGFFRVKVEVDTNYPLTTGCWLPRDNNKESWIEFRYERLQDFCYRCGRIGHPNTECHFEAVKGGMAGYGEWTKTAPVRDISETPRQLPINQGERRHAGAMRVGRNVSNRTQGAAGNGEKDTIEGERAVEVTESEEGPDLKIIHSQPDQISQPISISRGDKWTGKNKKRELDVINRDVGQSTRKKSRVAAGNNGVNDNEGEGKGIDLVQNHVGASSQGGGGWPSTATTSP
ncbi:hypothetical protein ACFX2A_025041 [Malus domestica]